MIQEYQYVYEVYKEKSFSRAAQNLYISQPSLSATIRKIETKLGFKIFDRSTSKLELTPEGTVYIEAAEKILILEQDLHDYFNSLSDLQAGTLSIAGTALFSSCVIPYIVRIFTEMHPKVKLSFLEADSLMLYDESLKNRVDVIIDSGYYDEELFDAEPIFTENLLLAVPKDCPMIDQHQLKELALSAADIKRGRHLKDDCPQISIELLKDSPFIVLNAGHDMHRRIYSICKESGFVPNAFISLNQLMTCFHVASAGLGSALITDTLIRHSHTLAPLWYFKLKLADTSLDKREVFIAYRKQRPFTPAMQHFIKAAKMTKL